MIKDNVNLHPLFGKHFAHNTKQDRWFVKMPTGKYLECLKPYLRWVLLYR